MAPGARNDATAPSRATRKTASNIATPEESQDIKDSLEGRKFLEKYSLLCPAGEPASNHQEKPHLLISKYQLKYVKIS